MKKVLFINADKDKSHCAVFQAGQIYGEALKLSKELDVEILEVGSASDPLPDPSAYDAVIFNYQHLTMEIIPPAYFSWCPVAIGFLYEARQVPHDSPMHFGDLKAGELFDILISPDPTLGSSKKVWGVPRVIPRFPKMKDVLKNGPPWISTFGFPSPWKNLKGVVEMMNEEFEEATFRLNFASASHQDGTPLHERQLNAAKELQEIARPGINISVTQHYFNDSELNSWLSASDLNVFLSYEERGLQTGGALLASADAAIAARRPIMVSDNIEARHLSPYVCAKTLKEAMNPNPLMVPPVQFLYDIWSPENFAGQIDKLVRERW